MDARFVYVGDTIDYTPASAVTAGSVIAMGNLIGIAHTDIATGTLGAIRLTGVYDIAKANEAITAGAFVYWDATNKWVTIAASDNQFFGIAIRAAAADDSSARVLIQQFRPQSVETVPTMLTAPAPTATATANTTAEVAFAAVPHAASYAIRRATTAAGLLSEAGTAATYANGKVSEIGLTANTVYYWQVKAVGDGTNYTDSDWSVAVMATTTNT